MAQQNITVISATSVSTPQSGQKALFFDADNSDLLSAKDDQGNVTVI